MSDNKLPADILDSLLKKEEEKSKTDQKFRSKFGEKQTESMPLRLLQRMKNLKIPEHYFSIVYLSSNYVNFCYHVKKVKKDINGFRVKKKDRNILMEEAEKIALRYRHKNNISGDINDQPILIPDFKMKK